MSTNGALVTQFAPLCALVPTGRLPAGTSRVLPCPVAHVVALAPRRACGKAGAAPGARPYRQLKLAASSILPLPW